MPSIYSLLYVDDQLTKVYDITYLIKCKYKVMTLMALFSGFRKKPNGFRRMPSFNTLTVSIVLTIYSQIPAWKRMTGRIKAYIFTRNAS